MPNSGRNGIVIWYLDIPQAHVFTPWGCEGCYSLYVSALTLGISPFQLCLPKLLQETSRSLFPECMKILHPYVVLTGTLKPREFQNFTGEVSEITTLFPRLSMN